MSSKWLASGVSLAALALCVAAAAGPKPAHPRVNPAPARRVPMARFQPGRGNLRDLIARVPNMNQMPESRLVGGLQTDRSGPIYTDTRGKAIGRMNLTTGKVVWFGKSPGRNARPR